MESADARSAVLVIEIWRLGFVSDFVLRISSAAADWLSRRAAREPHMDGTDARGEQYGILVVDDEESIRQGCSQVLSKLGHRLRTAPDAEKALVMVRELVPDLIILDLKMPGMGGMEFLAHIHETHPEAVVIVITGYATLESAVEAMKNGAYDFLPKPFTPDELKLVVGRGLEKRRLVLRAATLEKEQQLIRDNFATVVSHQLRSPVLAAEQYLEAVMFQHASTMPPDLKAKLDRVYARLSQLSELVTNWLRFFKVGGALRPQDLTDVDLGVAAREAWDMVLGKTSSPVEFVLNVQDGTPPVRGNRELVVELLCNLLNNAVKYAHERGHVVVRVKPEPPWAVAAVSDDGIGIPEDDLPRVFDCFYRGSGEIVRKAQGIGVGLAVVKKIVDSHGGSIHVTSKVGQGTTFIVRLPIAHEAPQSPSAEMTRAKPAGVAV
ncbi:MAG: response regulator [Planctomycetes bacterium]|nr:response regulator [Planctomycetota bacterium]